MTARLAQVKEFIATADERTLIALESAISEVRAAQIAALADDAVDSEVAAIRERFRREEICEAEDRIQRRHQHRLDLRERLRFGNLPDHLRQCSTCVRAILTLAHANACPQGKRYTGPILP